MNDVTRILSAIEEGDPRAAEGLLPLVYDELRRLAAEKLAREKAGQTLDATALVHEAYVRLVANLAREGGGDAPPGSRPEFANRAHFFAAAAEAMRRIMIDRARARATAKRGGDRQRVNLDHVPAEEPDSQLLALDDALTDLERHDSTAAQLVKLRYFVGLSHQDSAESLGISRRVADRIWVLARAWLYQQLQRN